MFATERLKHRKLKLLSMVIQTNLFQTETQKYRSWSFFIMPKMSDAIKGKQRLDSLRRCFNH